MNKIREKVMRTDFAKSLRRLIIFAVILLALIKKPKKEFKIKSKKECKQRNITSAQI